MLPPSFSSLCSWEAVEGYEEAVGSPGEHHHHAHGGDGDAHVDDGVGAYLIFVISFTQAGFFNPKFYTQKMIKNTPKH